MSDADNRHTHTFTIEVASYGDPAKTKKAAALAISRFLYLNFENAHLVGFKYVDDAGGKVTEIKSKEA